MLASLGESPISTIDPPPTSDAEEALQRLDETDLDVQSEGWWWNREHDFPLSQASDGTISLPAMTLRMVPSASNFGTFDVVDRGGKIYDRANHTFVFPAGTTLKAELIGRLDWDSLPQVARSVIVYEATQLFHSGKQGSQVVLQVNAETIRKARARLEQYEDDTAQHNTIRDNTNVQQAIYGVGGMRRNRGGL
jgi:hypothetical protein